MTRFFLLLAFMGASLLPLMAQTTHNISLGSSYVQGQYYNLSNDNTSSLDHANWDIAFSVYGNTDAGIFINEGSSFSGTPPTLYVVPNKVFSDNITTSDFGNTLSNPEEAWSTGAFNTTKVAGDWMDYGWGSYDMTSHEVLGTRLYVLEWGNGTYKKMTIDRLVSGVYHFRYADLDGSNLQQRSVDKSTYPNQTLAYFSFATNTASSAEPAGGWDFLFTRYETTLYSTGTPTPYTVGGILINQGVEAVLADGIDPVTVDIANYTTHADSLTLVGHDWKSFDFSTGWSVDNDRVYFVKTANDQLYKVEFIDFQGSSSGIATFQKTYLGVWNNLQKRPNSLVTQLGTYPNPATTEINVTFSLSRSLEGAELSLCNTLGQVVHQQLLQTQTGLNGLVVPTNHLPRGTYFLTLQAQDEVLTTAVIIQ
ncbi:MAG: T9SS type A sorting domain-containing protein [Aureispira sp.]